MTILQAAAWAFVSIGFAILIIVTAYFAARAGAFAWYRTKREHLRTVLDELKEEGDENGK